MGGDEEIQDKDKEIIWSFTVEQTSNKEEDGLEEVPQEKGVPHEEPWVHQREYRK